MAAGLIRRPDRAAALAIACAVAGCASCQKPAPSPQPPPQSDVLVSFTNTTGSDRPLLLYSGMQQGVCRHFEPHVGTPSVTLPAVSWDPACPVEFDVFTPALGAYGLALSPTAPGDEDWFKNVLSAATVTLPLPPLQPVPVAVWLVAKAADRPTAQAVVDREFSSAKPILDSWGAGFSLATTTTTLTPGAIEPDCGKVDAIESTPGVYDPDAINVYFVENYKNKPFSSYAITCWIQNHPEIIFVSWGNTNTPDDALAHEFGHALGLTILTDPTIGGHTNDVTGFDEFNLMVSGTDGYTNISVGQLYGMNFGARSWLHRPGSTTTTISRDCQDSWDGPPSGSGSCPALRLFQSGWPP